MLRKKQTSLKMFKISFSPTRILAIDHLADFAVKALDYDFDHVVNHRHHEITTLRKITVKGSKRSCNNRFK